ncbi:MAG: hypothetical protein KDA96_04470, partial [Planctomycetaceae bacterium]|nr:hypothetical protein [Planctomycetaceae bacterium]
MAGLRFCSPLPSSHEQPRAWRVPRIAESVGLASRSLIVAAALMLLPAGCGTTEPPVADDEAAVRARVETGDEDVDLDEAAREYFYPRHVEDYFAGMDAFFDDTSPDAPALPTPLIDLGKRDQPLKDYFTPPRNANLTESEILGRNTWMIWCGGNEGFWDWLATDSLGFIDLLKLLDSRQRAHRFENAGLINEPGMVKTSAARQDEFGLWLDQPDSTELRKWRTAYVQQTFAAINSRTHKSQRGLPGYRGQINKDKQLIPYDPPGSYMPDDKPHQDKAGTYATSDYSDDKYKEVPPPDIYGLSSGVVGLRLFPNPNFDAVARLK